MQFVMVTVGCIKISVETLAQLSQYSLQSGISSVSSGSQRMIPGWATTRTGTWGGTLALHTWIFLHCGDPWTADHTHLDLHSLYCDPGWFWWCLCSSLAIRIQYCLLYCRFIKVMALIASAYLSCVNMFMQAYYENVDKHKQFLPTFPPIMLHCAIETEKRKTIW